jgi:anti-sigma B factor antagonist
MSLINVTKDRGIAVVELLMKRLDASMAVPFKEEAIATVNGGERKVVLDLNQVDFVDSSGLGAMVSILKAVGERGSLAVCGVKPGVLTLFKLTRMDKVFAIHPDAPQAVASMAP